MLKYAGWCLILIAMVTYTIVQYRKKGQMTGLVTAGIISAGALILYMPYLTGQSDFLYATYDGYVTELPHYQMYMQVVKGLLSGNGISFMNLSIGFGSVKSYDQILYPTTLIPIMIGLIKGEKWLMIALAWMQALKVVLAGSVMYGYLRELKMKHNTCGIGACMYAFCGALALRGFWPFLGDEIYIAVLIFWALERYFTKRSWQWIPLAFMLVVWRIDLYHVYLYGILLILYAAVRCYLERYTLAHSIVTILKQGMLGLLGVSIWSAVILGFELNLFDSARFDIQQETRAAAGSLIANIRILFNAVYSVLSTGINGAFADYSGPLNLLEQPLLYCGIAAVLMIPQAIRFASKQIRTVFLAGIILVGCWLCITPMTDLFNAYIVNMELSQRSYRLSGQWVIIFMVVMAAYGYNKIKITNDIDRKLLIVSIGILAAVLLVVCSPLAKRLGFTLHQESIVSVFVFVMAWYMLLAKDAHNTMVFVCLLLAEMLSANALTISSSTEYANKQRSKMTANETGYYGDMPEAVAWLKAYDTGLYRVAIDIDEELIVTGGISGIRYLENLYFDLPGTAYYTNIDGAAYAFMSTFDTDAFAKRTGSKYSLGVADSYDLALVTGYRYRLAPASVDKAYDGYTKLQTIGDVDIYQIDTALSLGVSFTQYVTESDIADLTEQQKQYILLRAVVLPDDAETSLDHVTEAQLQAWAVLSDEEANAVQISREAAQERLDTGIWDIQSYSGGHILGSITSKQNEELVFSLAYNEGWTVLVDGKKADTHSVDLGFMGVALEAGEHTIELIFTPRHLMPGVMISIIAAGLYIIMLIYSFKYRKRNFISVNKENV